MKLVKCVDNKNRENELSINRIYKVLWENDWHYEVNCDNGKIVTFFKSRFTEVQTEQTKEECKNIYCKSYNEDCNNNCQIDNYNECMLSYIPKEETNKMKLVKCINNKGLEILLTINKLYMVLDENHNYIKIIDDKGEKYFYNKNRFEEVQLEQSKEELIKPTYYNKDNGISPFEYIKANNLDFFEGNVIKYITRYKEKNGIEDLIKAKTYLEEVIKNYKK